MGDAVRTLLRGVGQTLITLGVVLLLFCVYELKVTNVYTGREQTRLEDDLRERWGTQAPAMRPVAVSLGSGLAVLRVPRFGADWAKVVVEGVSVADLKKGPGHYPGTALPGEVGNTVISGHRTTYGAPFGDVDRLRRGDAVVVETRDTWFTYRVTSYEVVSPRAVEVTYAVPRRKGVRPTERLLTLTTCHPRYSAKQRYVVFARLESRLPKAGGAVPPALSAPQGA